MNLTWLKKSLGLHRREYSTARGVLAARREDARAGGGGRTKGVVTAEEAKGIRESKERVSREHDLIERRKRQIARAGGATAHQATSSGRAKAVLWARAQAGTVEQPAGSNSGPKISDWQRETARGGSWLQRAPWCGVFVENACRRQGVATSSRWASVAFIEDDARARRNGFRGWTTSPGTPLRGDLVIVGGRGVHVELFVSYANGVVHTVGGNTSPGVAGSQSNGGGVWERARPLSSVYGFALVDYPG